MNFVSYGFVFLFIPIVLAGWFCIQKWSHKKKLISELYLIVMSLVFYGWYNVLSLIVFVPMLLLNWLGTYFMQKISRRKGRLYLCIFLLLLNIGTWLLFKYENTFRISFCRNLSLLVPIGISFYTMQQIMFLVDSYRNENLKYTVAEYLTYSTFFPCIISGPIVRHDEFIQQLRKQFDGSNLPVDYTKIQQGIVSFSLGMGKKVLIAKQLGVFADYGFSRADSASSLVTVLSIISYTFQLYFDFSGYCDMAEGIALMLGFSLPRNFESPYKAVTINEFWKKWHTSLTRFLTQYVYFPLGGGRNGALRRSINILIVYLISGFWHGASLTFIVWGIIHAFLMIVDKLTEKFQFKQNHRIVNQCITFLLVSLAWVPFRVKKMENVIMIYGNILNGGFVIEDDFWKGMCASFFLIIRKLLNVSSVIFLQECAAILFMLCIAVAVFKGKNVRELREKYYNSTTMAAICAVVLWLSVMQFASVNTFIYEGF